MKIDGPLPVNPAPVDKPATAREERNPQLLDAAKMYEQAFLRQMVQAMRKTVTESDFQPPSMAEKIFKDQLDDKYIENWSDRGGVGFADLIYDHIVERYGNQRGVTRPRGPVPMGQGSKLSVGGPGEGGRRETRVKIQRDPKANETSLQCPWSGTVTQVQHNEGQSLYVLNHENGLRSKILSTGKPSVVAGQIIDAGQSLGRISAGESDVYWTLSASQTKESV